MTNKEKYRELCSTEKSIPLFSQDWWLDSVTDSDSWDVSLVIKDNTIIASMPYVLERRFGLVLIRQPLLTQTLGPWIRESGVKYTKRLSQEKEIMNQLIDNLPKFDFFSQNWHFSITNWLPFHWRGFTQTTRYTYILSELENLENVFENFSPSYRNKIRKAQKIVQVKRNLSIAQFYRLNELTFSRQKLRIPYPFNFLQKHDAALNLKNRRMIFYAEDNIGKIHSSLYLTWDSMSAYVHMVGEDPELRSSGAGILLIWEAIRYTRDELKLNRFDFEGSMIETVEVVRRDCGGIQTPYFTVSKTNSRMLQIKQVLKTIIRG